MNISSIGGLVPTPHLLPYVASKFALAGFSQGLRAELSQVLDQANRTYQVGLAHGLGVLIGDSGLRIDGAEVFINDTELDLVMARLRVEAYRMVGEAGGRAEERARVGRACAFYGAAKLHPDVRPWLDEAKRRLLYERSLTWCRARFPAVPEADIRLLLDTGISGQAQFANNTASPLSYAVLDGFGVPLPLAQVIDRPRVGMRSIELFTDGYFKPGAAPSLDDWEAAFAEVERVDPEKIARYPAVKGSTTRMNTDDRTVVIVHF